MRIEVVAVGTEHAGEAVSRVSDLDLAHRAGGGRGTSGRSLGLAARTRAPARRSAAVPARRQLRLEAVLEVAVDEVMVVVAGEEDQPLADQVGSDQVE